MMLCLISWPYVLLSLYFHIRLVTALPQINQVSQRMTNLSVKNLCPAKYSQNSAISLCVRCTARHILDMRRCISTELNQKRADGMMMNFPYGFTDDILVDGSFPTVPPGRKFRQPLAGIAFGWNDLTIVLTVNIDSCSRVDWGSLTGPFNTTSQIATIGNIVDQLFDLEPRRAIEVVRDNAALGKQEAESLLKKIFPDDIPSLTISQEIESIARNATLKAISTVLYKGVGGGLLMIGVQASAHALTSVHPAVDQAIEIGAVLFLILQIYLAIIDWLTEVLDKDPNLGPYGWTMWIVQAVISRLQALSEVIARQSPSIPRLDREALDRLVEVLARSARGFRLPQLGMTEVMNTENVNPTGPDAC